MGLGTSCLLLAPLHVLHVMTVHSPILRIQQHVSIPLLATSWRQTMQQRLWNARLERTKVKRNKRLALKPAQGFSFPMKRA